MKVTAVLARGPGEPDGNIGDRLLLDVQLTPQGRLDPALLLAADTPWTALREKPDGSAVELVVEHDDGLWALRRASSTETPLRRLTAQVLRPGEYITVEQQDDELLFRVVAVEAG